MNWILVLVSIITLCVVGIFYAIVKNSFALVVRLDEITDEIREIKGLIAPETLGPDDSGSVP